MTDNIQANPSKKPTHIAYHVRQHSGRDAFWTRIGSAWAHADGKGYSIQLSTTPVDGRISLRLPPQAAN